MKLTVGEAIVKFLDNQYTKIDSTEQKLVEYFYTIFGHGCVLGIGEALAETDHSFKVLQGKNEQGMALAAVAYAKEANRMKVIPCVSSIGPGSANMVTAAAVATVNNLPLLLLVGDTYASRKPDPVLQQVERADSALITTNDVFKPVAKYFDRVYRADMLMSALENAMRVLTNPSETGAAVICLPQDVQGESYDFDDTFFEKRVREIERPRPSESEIEKAVSLISKAKKPAIIVGGGARYSLCSEILTNISQNCTFPLLETQAGKSVVAGSHPNNLGGLGVTGNAAANLIASEADLIIAVGSRLTDFTTASKSLYPNAKIVSINISAYHSHKQDALSVTGDAKATLEIVAKRLYEIGYKTNLASEIKQAKELWKKEYNRLSKIAFCEKFVPEVTDRTQNTVEDFAKVFNTSITQTAAIAKVREVIAPDAVIVGASGSLPGCLQRMWETDSVGSYNMEYGYSCMGYEIAGAFGAKIAKPSKEVYAMVGDGSYLMMHSEMVTAVQNGVKINVLLFDNGGFGCINNLQMGKGIKSLATEFRDQNNNFLKIDYAMNAGAYGFKTYTARTLDELEKALKDSKSVKESVLIDIKVLPKTMTNGYGGFWYTGLNSLPRNEKQKQALLERDNKKIRRI
jgi:3D-(3,5/4)-trihydroxycyclohexane-1,2-dione acylhydrolase (decyclizing)